MKELVRLSASRIKTLQECSWYYWARYHLKLPDKSNAGALRGSCCHDLFELLTKPKWIELAKSLHENGNIEEFPLIARFLRAKCYQYQLDEMGLDGKSNKTNIGLIYEMIMVGLGAGFFPEPNEEILDSEYYFDIHDTELKFRIAGYIDKILFNTETKELLISDYKSSKGQFKGEDLETNIQAMIYSLASNYLKKSKKLPDFKKVVARFVFLRFAENPYQNLEFTDEQLDGFKHYLAYLSDIINNFDIDNAQTDFAALDPARRWKCSTKSGWKCPYKDSFTYWAVVKDGKVKSTLFEDDYAIKGQLIELKDGEKWEQMTYDGCPIHKITDDHFNF